MIKKLLLDTNIYLISISLLLLRFTLGIIIFIVGAGKVMGWFGGKGLEQAAERFVQFHKLPVLLGYMSFFTEFFGGMLLILGLFSRPVAIAVTINFLVATIRSWPRGFTADAAYPFSLMIIALVILLIGPMKYSLDYLIFGDKNGDFDSVK